MMKTRYALVASAIVGCSTSDVSAAPPDGVDQRELVAMRAQSPHAAELYDKGEALAAAGNRKDAEALFKQSHTEYPDASIPWRRDCEMLIDLGQRKDAITACSYAVGVLRSGANQRALVSALVDGAANPTTIELSLALTIVAKEHHLGPSVTAAAAACDIAERIGDQVMLQGCTQELRRLAPNDPATGKALSVLAARCPPWRFWSGWGPILAAIVLTLGHALWGLARKWRSRRAGIAALAAIAVALASWPGAADAEEQKRSSNWLSKRPVDDENPESNIPSEKERDADPLEFGYWLQDVALKGEHASKRGNHASAARFYEALSNAVPDRAIGFIKACEEYEALGDREKAIDRCGAALLRDGLRVQDYTHFVHLVVGRPGRLSEKETAALAQVLQHMKDDPAGHAAVDDLECEVGAKTSNVAQLKECTAALMARAPADRRTISYRWALAIADGQTGEADDLIRQAVSAGVAPAEIEKMKKETAGAAMKRSLRVGALTVAIGLLVAGIVLVARSLLARKRPAAEATVGAPAHATAASDRAAGALPPAG